MSVPIGDPRKAGEEGPAGDQRAAGESGPAGDPREGGQATVKSEAGTEAKQAPKRAAKKA